MNKKELVSSVVDLLKENGISKPVQQQKTTLHISDDDGNMSDFVIRKPERGLMFTNKDVTAVIDALIAIIEDSLRHGEEISIHGFGTLGVKYREARQTKHPATGEAVSVDARYVPDFQYGNGLRKAARVYGVSKNEAEAGK